MADIITQNPATVPSSDPTVFDQWRLLSFNTDWPNPSGVCTAVLILRRCRRGEDGNLIDISDDEAKRAGVNRELVHFISDAFGEAVTNPAVGNVLMALIGSIQAIVDQQG